MTYVQRNKLLLYKQSKDTKDEIIPQNIASVLHLVLKCDVYPDNPILDFRCYL